MNESSTLRILLRKSILRVRQTVLEQAIKEDDDGVVPCRGLFNSQLKVFVKLHWSSSPENGSKVIKTLQLDALPPLLPRSTIFLFL